MGFFVATSDDIKTAAATNAASGVSSASQAGRSASKINPNEQIKASVSLKNIEAADAGDAAGDSVARILGRRARAIPGGPHA